MLRDTYEKIKRNKVASYETLASLDDLLLKFTLIHSRDVRFCPVEGCGYAGVV